jgi:uncharacterized protein YgiM (DUF1202 family)
MVQPYGHSPYNRAIIGTNNFVMHEQRSPLDEFLILPEETVAWEKTSRWTAAIILIGMAACHLQASGPPSKDVIDTAIAQTGAAKNDVQLAVIATLTAMAGGDVPLGQSPTAEQPGVPPTVTLTPTSGKVTVAVSKGTNCRTGPDVNFDLVIVLHPGETAEVVGKDAYGNYWIIKDPKNPSVTCWLCNKNATVTGDTSKLPVVESPPTPTPKPGMITEVSIAVSNPVLHSPNCGNNFFTQSGTVTLTASGPSAIAYYLTLDSNYKGSFTQPFASAGTQNFPFVFDFFSTCMTHTLKAIVTSPNSMGAQTTFSVASP